MGLMQREGVDNVGAFDLILDFELLVFLDVFNMILIIGGGKVEGANL